MRDPSVLSLNPEALGVGFAAPSRPDPQTPALFLLSVPVKMLLTARNRLFLKPVQEDLRCCRGCWVWGAGSVRDCHKEAEGGLQKNPQDLGCQEPAAPPLPLTASAAPGLRAPACAFSFLPLRVPVWPARH